MICIICAQSRPYVFTAQENKIDFSFLSTFITSVQMNVGHIPARSIFMQPTLERARELLESRGGSCHFFSYGFLFSRFSAKFACITLRARCQLKGVLTKGPPPAPPKGRAAAGTGGSACDFGSRWAGGRRERARRPLGRPAEHAVTASGARAAGIDAGLGGEGRPPGRPAVEPVGSSTSLPSRQSRLSLACGFARFVPLAKEQQLIILIKPSCRISSTAVYFIV